MLVREWGPVTLFVNGVVEPDAATLQQFQARGVAVERRPVSAIVSGAEGLKVQLADGNAVHIAGLFTQPRSRPSSDIGQQLGCLHAESPFGPILSVDETKQTTVSGVFAAGDVARAAPNVPFAVADGAMAGVAAHRSLVFG
jgi:thioredoxin reductase